MWSSPDFNLFTETEKQFLFVLTYISFIILTMMVIVDFKDHKKTVKLYCKRKLYSGLYKLANNAPSNSSIVYGFHRRFKKPEDVQDDELDNEIQNIGKAIKEADL